MDHFTGDTGLNTDPCQLFLRDLACLPLVSEMVNQSPTFNYYYYYYHHYYYYRD